MDEYQELATCCANAGSRSLAEFARASVLHNVRSMQLLPGTLAGDLTTVTRALLELDASLGDTQKRIRGVLGKVGKDRGS